MKTKAPPSAPPARSCPFSRRLLQPLGFAVHGFSPPTPLPAQVWAWFQRGLYPFYWVLWSFCRSPPLPRLGEVGAGEAAPLPAWGLPHGHHNGSSRVLGPSPHPAPSLRLDRGGEVPVGALLISRSRSNTPRGGLCPRWYLCIRELCPQRVRDPLPARATGGCSILGRSQHRRVHALELWVQDGCRGGSRGPIFTYKENFRRAPPNRAGLVGPWGCTKGWAVLRGAE